MRQEDLRKTRVISQEFISVAKRNDKDSQLIKDALKIVTGKIGLKSTVLSKIGMESTIFSKENGLFGIKKATQHEVIEFVNAISETNLVKYMSKMTPSEFSTGHVNINNETTLSIESDGNNSFKASFGSKKTTHEIIKDLLTKKQVDTKKLNADIPAIQLDPLNR